MTEVVIIIKPVYLICAVGSAGDVNILIYKQQKSSKAAVEAQVVDCCPVKDHKEKCIPP